MAWDAISIRRSVDAMLADAAVAVEVDEAMLGDGPPATDADDGTALAADGSPAAVEMTLAGREVGRELASHWASR